MGTRFNIRSLIGENIDAALFEHQLSGEQPTWDLSYVAVPTPEGMAVQGMLVITIATALMEPMTSAMLLEPRTLLDPEHADRVVMQAMVQMRESVSQVLAQQQAQVSDLVIPSLVDQRQPAASGSAPWR